MLERNPTMDVFMTYTFLSIPILFVSIIYCFGTFVFYKLFKNKDRINYIFSKMQFFTTNFIQG